MEPLVSVILTSYNHEQFIGQAIESVLVQTYTNFELFIVDDCSTDSSWEIIKAYTDPRIIAIRNERNIRIEGWGLIALRQAKGKYIAIHHSDDAWKPEKLEFQVEFLERNPEYGAAFTLVDIIDEEGNLILDDRNAYSEGIFRQKNRSRHEWLNQFFYEGNVLCHPSVMIRRQLYNELDLLEYGYAQIPDFMRWIKLCLCQEIWIIQKNLTKFRVLKNEMNASGNRPDVHVRSTIEMYRILSLYLKMNNSEDMLKAFPETEKFLIGTEMVTEYVFARLCMDHPSNVNKLFGLQLMFQLINDKDKSKKIKELYHYSHMHLIDDTAKYDIFNVCDGSYISNSLIRGRIYYHYGNGYEAKDYFQCEGHYQSGTFKYDVDIPLKVIKGGRLAGLRFDPLEGIPCRIKIVSFETNILATQLLPITLSSKKAGWDEFYNIDPIYEISGNIEEIKSFNIVLEIEGVHLKEAVQEQQANCWRLQKKNDEILQKSNEALGRLNESEIHRIEMIAQLNEKNIQLDDVSTQLNLKNALLRDITAQLDEQNVQLNDMQIRLEQSSCLLEEKEKDIVVLENVIEKAKTESELLRSHIEETYKSFSWRITKPLRFVKRLIHK